MRILALDIETDSAATTTGPTPAALDPRVAGVLSVAVWDSVAGCAEYFSGDERQLLGDLDTYLTSSSGGVVVTWNGANFDLPFLATRFEHHQLSNGLRLRPTTDRPAKYAPCPGGHPGGYRGSWGDHDHADIAYPYQARARSLGVAWSLKPVATALRIDMVHVDAAKCAELSEEQLREYNISDVRGTAALAQRLPALELARWLDSIA
jgi:DNA polymerase elongation subunit (family B)